MGNAMARAQRARRSEKDIFGGLLVERKVNCVGLGVHLRPH